MRIVIYSIFYKPDLTGIGKYTGEMAEWLVTQGHDVHVVTAPPYYPQWQVSEDYSSWLYRRETLAGVTVWRCPLWVPSKLSGLKRIVHLASFAVSSFPIMLSKVFWRPDVVMVIEPPLFCAPVSLILSWLCRARSWLHVQDFEVDAAFDLGILSSPRLRHRVLSGESWLMAKFDMVSTISDQMMKRLDAKGVLPERQWLFPNWVDTDQIYPVKSSNVFREQLGISGTNIVFLYSGNMGEKQGLEVVVEAARRLIDFENITFVMCGHGAVYSRLHELARGLNNMHWLPLQPLDKLNDLLNMADVHLLPQRADAADIVMPSKLTGMLASGRAILATAFEGTQIAKVLETTGVIVPPGNVEQFASAMLALAENDQMRLCLGESARKYAVENIGHDTILPRFEECLKRCVNR